MRRETRKLLGYFVWKITILCQKIIFSPILGGAPRWIHPCGVYVANLHLTVLIAIGSCTLGYWQWKVKPVQLTYVSPAGKVYFSGCFELWKNIYRLPVSIHYSYSSKQAKYIVYKYLTRVSAKREVFFPDTGTFWTKAWIKI